MYLYILKQADSPRLCFAKANDDESMCRYITEVGSDFGVVQKLEIGDDNLSLGADVVLSIPSAQCLEKIKYFFPPIEHLDAIKHHREETNIEKDA